MIKNPYLYSFAVLVFACLVVSLFLVGWVNTHTLKAEEIEKTGMQNSQLQKIKQKKKCFLKDINSQEAVLKKYKEAWIKKLEGIETMDKARARLQVSAAEGQSMFSDKLMAEKLLGVEVIGKYFSIMKWVHQLEKTFLNFRIVEINFRSSDHEMLTGTFVLENFDVLSL